MCGWFPVQTSNKNFCQLHIYINRQWSSPLDSSAQTILEEQKGGEKALKVIFIQDIYTKKTADLENRGHFTMAVKNYKEHSS